MADTGYARTAPSTPPSELARWVLLVFIVVWFGFQILFPLRHLLYPGNVHWTEEGHRFSWMMKLRDKKALTAFTVRDPVTGAEWTVAPEEFLLRHQASKVGTRPDMILQYAHYLAEIWAEKYGMPNMEVRVRTCVSLNGRPAALMIDPERDLTKIKRDLAPANWILPLNVPFERPPNRPRRRDLNC